MTHRTVIVGGGFAGLTAARELSGAPVEVTLVDRRNFHLFQPLLYQVATGGLSPANIAAPLRSILKRQRNATVLLGDAVDLDVAGRRLLLSDGELPYDTLVVAAGVRHHYFGRPEWEALAPGLKTLEDATEIRRRVLLAFEAAEREEDDAARRAWLTFVVVGGGPTGVELAGALAEIARTTLLHDFRRIDPSQARILLVEGAERLLPTFAPQLSARAAVSVARLGVEVRTGARVVDVTALGVALETGGAREEIAARTVLWAAGIAASPLGALLARAAGATLDRAGRVVVGPDLTVPGHAELFVIGDLAAAVDASGQPLPGVAPVAMQQGAYVARLLEGRLAGRSVPPFRYRDKGSLAVIGRDAAVADLPFARLWGFPAWLVWLFVHLMYLVQFANRLLVFLQWALCYLGRNRFARLITGPSPLPLPGKAQGARGPLGDRGETTSARR